MVGKRSRMRSGGHLTGQVQQHVGIAVRNHLVVDGPGHHVARRQVAPLAARTCP